MPTINGQYYPSPEHERKKYWKWYCQLRKQIEVDSKEGYRMWHHERAAERLLCWSQGRSAQHIKGV